MDIEKKALALVNEFRAATRNPPFADWSQVHLGATAKSLLRAIEQHEAFRREVSEAVQDYIDHYRQEGWLGFDHFIIPQADPLVEVMNAWWHADGYASIETFRAALAARGLEIVKKEPSQ